MKKNCWEFMKCGRGLKSGVCDESDTCPAATFTRLDGVHGGKNGGRACWVVAGTFCQGETKGCFAKKINHCHECEFYQKVRSEDFPDAVLLRPDKCRPGSIKNNN